MSRYARLNGLYANTAAIKTRGVELFAVGDPAGAQLNTAIRRLLLSVRDDDPEIWADLLGAAKSLRWRLITQPQPLALNSSLVDGIASVRHEVGRLRSGIGGAAAEILDVVDRAAEAVGRSDPPMGAVLLRCIAEVGGECVVLAEGRRAAAGLSGWLADEGVRVMTATELRRSADADMSTAYAVGPPCVFGAALLTAPPVEELSFVLPAWFADRSTPQSLLAPLSVGSIRVPVSVREEGDHDELPQSEVEVEDELRPLPVWGSAPSGTRVPGSDEVVAHKVLLGGERAIYLDEAGDRIRALDPSQPPDDRVVQLDVAMLRPGAYLVLREGQTERQMLYDRTVGMLGTRAEPTLAAQARWKAALQDRLHRTGPTAVVDALRARGVQSAGQAPWWIEETVVRPRRNEDFERLLQWLDIPLQPTYTLATNFRRLRGQASADVREQLERAVAAADLSALESHGFLRLDLKEPGFSGIIAARVLAISPHSTVVPRYEVRVPFVDRSAQWLE